MNFGRFLQKNQGHTPFSELGRQIFAKKQLTYVFGRHHFTRDAVRNSSAYTFPGISNNANMIRIGCYIARGFSTDFAVISTQAEKTEDYRLDNYRAQKTQLTYAIGDRGATIGPVLNLQAYWPSLKFSSISRRIVASVRYLSTSQDFDFTIRPSGPSSWIVFPLSHDSLKAVQYTRFESTLYDHCSYRKKLDAPCRLKLAKQCI